ncbi:UNKNOWN [Stylonychia lemnae]|uniref:YHYH domain containing protein n=1 Tax=Stylonychia lemnae TaxID=5949 RepID=A0A078B703_STYLE|nr:UNKNOWN [Stylonychia lemnae]|eukprot:CDW89971.1 UNKNOWN [Stylonychia lemnae]
MTNIHMLFTIPILVLLFNVKYVSAQILWDSYQNCVQFERLLDCTDCRDAKDWGGVQLPYDDIPLDDYFQDYELVVCKGPGMCPDGTVKNVCTWQRYLFFNCFEGSPVTYRWETNSMPNHCYFSKTEPPLGSETKFEAYSVSGAFNVQVNNMFAYNLVDPVFYHTKLETQDDYDKQLCKSKWAETTLIDMKTQYEEKVYYSFEYPIAFSDYSWDSSETTMLQLKSSDQVVGMAINGVLIFSANSINGYDALFPSQLINPITSQSNRITPDFCLGTAESYKTYRYYMFSPCIYDSIAKTYASSCTNDRYPLCSQDVRNHSIYYVKSEQKNINPIGIAKDGRMIYGPYNSYGQLWQACDVDICNGRYFSKGYNYGYVATMFHPYFISCWGPGNKVTFEAKCSTNARKKCTLYTSEAVLHYSFWSITLGLSILALLQFTY